MSLRHFHTSSWCCDLSSSLIFSRFAIAWPSLQLTVWPTAVPLPRLLRLLTSLLPQSGQRCISIVAATWPFPSRWLLYNETRSPTSLFLPFLFIQITFKNSATRHIMRRSVVWKRIEAGEAGVICLFKPSFCLTDGLGKTAAGHLGVLEKKISSTFIIFICSPFKTLGTSDSFPLKREPKKKYSRSYA